MTWKGHKPDQVIIDEADDIIDLVLHGPRPTSVSEVVIDGRRLLPSEYELTEDGRVRLLHPPEITVREPVVWTSDDPVEPGWYATIHCWDPDEGMFPGAHYWNGEHWQPQTSASIQHWRKVFETELEASDYAWEHDPER